MAGAVGANYTDIYEAVVLLSRSLAGRTDLRSLLSGVSDSLCRIVNFDQVGLILHNADEDVMQGYILNALGNPMITELRLPVDEDPAGWVWQHQQPLVIALQSESRWPEFVHRARGEFGINTMVLVPLTAG